MNRITPILCFAAMLSLAPARANDSHHQVASSASPSASVSSSLADGEIRKIDKSAGKITIKHGPIANLDMPNMTMVFRVKDAAMLDSVKPGDKVKFAAEKINGALTVTQIEAAK